MLPCRYESKGYRERRCRSRPTPRRASATTPRLMPRQKRRGGAGRREVVAGRCAGGRRACASLQLYTASMAVFLPLRVEVVFSLIQEGASDR